MSMKHKVNALLYYIPFDYQPCLVKHVTPYYEEGDAHAMITVEFTDNDVRTIPVAIQDIYLATEVPPTPKPRPELQPVVRKQNILQRIFSPAKKQGLKLSVMFNTGVYPVLLLLCSLSAQAQSGEPVSDTSYVTKQGSLFYETKMSTYRDGSEITTKTLIGDTLALVQAAKDRLVSRAATMSVDIRFVSTFRKSFTQLLRESDAVLALTGIDPQKAVQNEYSTAFLAGTWTIKRDGTNSDITFALNGQGALRYAINGGATKQAILIGQALRLKNYPSNGSDVDLYALPGGVWVDATRAVVLRPPGNNSPVNRAATAPPKASKKG